MSVQRRDCGGLLLIVVACLLIAAVVSVGVLANTRDLLRPPYPSSKSVQPILWSAVEEQPKIQNVQPIPESAVKEQAKSVQPTPESGVKEQAPQLASREEMFLKIDPVDRNAPARTISERHKNFIARAPFIEYPEHELVRKWIPPDATVLELGARFGTTTCEIAKSLKNSGRLVAAEPDRLVYEDITRNIKNNNCNALILQGAIGLKPLRMCASGYAGQTNKDCKIHPRGYKPVFVNTYRVSQVEQAVGLKFDTLLLDCEGCVEDALDELQPLIKRQIKLILLEADQGKKPNSTRQGGTDYESFKGWLKDSGFKIVDQFSDCDKGRTGVPARMSCKRSIIHYAFQRQIPTIG